MTKHARAIALTLAVLTAIAAKACAQETIEALAQRPTPTVARA